MSSFSRLNNVFSVILVKDKSLAIILLALLWLPIATTCSPSGKTIKFHERGRTEVELLSGAETCSSELVSEDNLAKYDPDSRSKLSHFDSVFSVFFDQNDFCLSRSQIHKGVNRQILDEEIDSLVRWKAVLHKRYVVLHILGRGTYGTVVEAYDIYQSDKCAIKMMPILDQNRENAEWELRNLRLIASDSRYIERHVISLRDYFEHRNFVCLVTDIFGQSLNEYIKDNDLLPLNNIDIKNIAFQLFQSIEFIHSLGLVHTDLKSDNILLLNKQCYRGSDSCSMLSSGNEGSGKRLRDSSIRVIDFGSAYFEWDPHDPVVTTSHYRAPEVMWGLRWSFPIDIWSVGCLLVELFTGQVLFLAHDDEEQLKAVETVFEYVSQRHQIAEGELHSISADTIRIFDHLDGSQNRTYRSRGLRKLHNAISPKSTFNAQFFDLLRQIFVRSRGARITAREALRHPWFKEFYEEL